MFDDRTLPDRYEATLIEVFPAHAPGNFTWYPDIGKWVWTTFNEHQWDLNWANPRVFLEIVDGDALPRQQGRRGAPPRCGGLHVEADGHALPERARGPRHRSQALRAASRIAAPGGDPQGGGDRLAAAISSPISAQGSHTGREGNLAYHNSLMVQFWSALATRDTRLMTHVLRDAFPDPSSGNATWATYLRCHDDIGWAVTDEDAAAARHLRRRRTAPSSPTSTRASFPARFARGALFQSNPGDRRQAVERHLRLALRARDGDRRGRSRRHRRPPSTAS